MLKIIAGNFIQFLKCIFLVIFNKNKIIGLCIFMVFSNSRIFIHYQNYIITI